LDIPKVRIGLATALVFFGALASTAASAAGDLEASWQARAAAARERLGKPGLDACDKAYESAFAKPNRSAVGKHPAYELRFNIGKRQMMAVYEFDGQSLSAFLLVRLPPGWLAYQKAHSKTLSVLVPTSKCAFDICTSNPFVDGACSGE